jgi:hypothetical protein
MSHTDGKQVFMIQRASEREPFSNGGAYPQWSQKGKVWSSMAGVKQHLAHRSEWKHKHYTLAQAEVVCFDMVESFRIPVREVIEMQQLSKRDRERRMEAAKVRAQLNSIRRQTANIPLLERQLEELQRGRTDSAGTS